MWLSLLSKIKSGESDLHDVIVGSGITLVLKILGALFSFFVTVLLSQSLGVYSFGIYSIAFSILMLSSTIARFGLNNAILKFVGFAYSENNWSSIIGLYKHAIVWVTMMTSLISAILFYSARDLSHNVFHVAELEPIIKSLGLVILPIALFNIYVSFFQAMGAVVKSAILSGVVVPFLMIIGIFLLNMFELNNTENMVFLYGFNSLLNLIVCHFIFRKVSIFEQTSSFSSKVLLSTCIPMFWIILAEYVAIHGPQLLLGAFWPPEEVAVFSICLRIATLISFILTSASRVVAPKIAILHSNEDAKGLAKLASITTIVMLCFASILSLGIIIFSEELLGLFGSEYINSRHILQLFALVQLIMVVFGLGKIVLQMSGYERECKYIVFFNALLIISFCFVFIPVYSSFGAVLSLLIAAIISTGITIMIIKKKLDFYLVGLAWLFQKRKLKI